MKKILAFALVVLLLASCCRITPCDLTCEYQQSPLVDTETPHLAWKNRASGNGAEQTAWQIVVRKGESLRSGELAWDSGKVNSAESAHIAYAGEALCSSSDYVWQVRVWDAQGRASRWSAPSRFHTGKFSPEEWQAEWIGTPWSRIKQPPLPPWCAEVEQLQHIPWKLKERKKFCMLPLGGKINRKPQPLSILGTQN